VPNQKLSRSTQIILSLSMPIFVYAITSIAVADELPNDLFLRCKGKIELMMFSQTKGIEPVLKDEPLDITLHLKDRTINDVTDSLVLGKECIFANGEIGCKLKVVRQVKDMDATEIIQSTIFLTRSTGELRALMQTDSFDGSHAVGKPSVTAQVKRTGICRKGDPIF
jgi:hypothetical protein